MPRISGQSVFEGRLIDWAIDRPLDLPRLPVELLSKQQKAAELQRARPMRGWALLEQERPIRLPTDTDPGGQGPGSRAFRTSATGFRDSPAVAQSGTIYP